MLAARARLFTVIGQCRANTEGQRIDWYDIEFTEEYRTIAHKFELRGKHRSERLNERDRDDADRWKKLLLPRIDDIFHFG
ncbi:MAG TPA: hypothetical protein VNR70_07645 [Steroidobacteraceae bacterium]|nr:hypothetical protein [Steroidobacteraceae bacterium]